jgi:hypothetical protein
MNDHKPSQRRPGAPGIIGLVVALAVVIGVFLKATTRDYRSQ